MSEEGDCCIERLGVVKCLGNFFCLGLLAWSEIVLLRIARVCVLGSEVEFFSSVQSCLSSEQESTGCGRGVGQRFFFFEIWIEIPQGSVSKRCSDCCVCTLPLSLDLGRGNC